MASSSLLLAIRSLLKFLVYMKKETSSSNSFIHLKSLISESIALYIFSGSKNFFACFSNTFQTLSIPNITHSSFFISTIQSVYQNSTSPFARGISLVLIEDRLAILRTQRANQPGIIFSRVQASLLHTNNGGCHAHTIFIADFA